VEQDTSDIYVPTFSKYPSLFALLIHISLPDNSHLSGHAPYGGTEFWYIDVFRIIPITDNTIIATMTVIIMTVF
jgi:hypothetical protein